ncbi:MAG: hypothetical protein ABIP80_04440, partial [Ferruginibacter sp.]
MQLRVLFILFFGVTHVHAQNEGRIKILEEKIAQAKNEDEKVKTLSDLAEFYFNYKVESKADSLLQKALLIAELSSDKELVFRILFSNNIINLDAWSNANVFEKSKKFIGKGLLYAQEQDRPEYVALAYIRLAGLERKRALYNEALQHTTEAFTALANVHNDSLQCVLYNELGDIYMAKGDAIPAYKN